MSKKESVLKNKSEANETAYWLSLLNDTEQIEVKLFNSLFQDCDELICMLVSTIKTMKSKNS